MKRKFSAVCMVLALMLTCLFAVPTQAAEEGKILNGDFSSWDSNKTPTDWDAGNTWRDVMVNDSAANPYMYFTCSTGIKSPEILVKAGETYTLSARVFSAISGFGSRVFWRFFDVNGRRLGTDDDYMNYCLHEAGAWRANAITRTAPAGATKLVIYLNCSTYPTIPEGMEAKDIMGYDDFKLTKGTQVLGERVSNSDMELLQNGMPTNFKVTGTAVLEKGEVHSGTNAIKVTGEAVDSVTTVSTFFFAEKGTPYYDISAYVNVDTIEGNGVKMEVYRWKNHMYDSTVTSTTEVFETGYFKASGKGWIKMMPERTKRYARSFDAVLEIRVTVEGKGTVYLDDFSANGTNNLLYNGELDGFSGDDKFIDLQGTAAYQTMSFDPNNPKAIYTEGGKNKYLYVHGASNEKAAYTFRGVWTTGAKYKFSCDVKSPEGGAAYISITNAGTGGGLGQTANNGTTWEHYELYFTCANTTGGFTHINLGTYQKNKQASFDNISLIKVDDEAKTTICDANGKAVEAGAAGSAYTANYHGFAKDYTAPEKEPVTLIFALYEKLEDGSLRLDTIKLKKGTPRYIERKNNLGAAIMTEGQLPLDLTTDPITIPNNDKIYEFRAYTWDDFTNMTPYYASISA